MKRSDKREKSQLNTLILIQLAKTNRKTIKVINYKSTDKQSPRLIRDRQRNEQLRERERERETNRINVLRVIGGSHFGASSCCLAVLFVNGETEPRVEAVPWQGQRR